MGGDFITNPSRISVRMILSALRSWNFSITTFTNLAQSLTSTQTSKRDAVVYIGVVKFFVAHAQFQHCSFASFALTALNLAGLGIGCPRSIP